MSFNEGFSTQGIPFITGSSDGQALGWSVAQQSWVATGSVAGSSTGGAVNTTNGIIGDGTVGNEIRLDESITVKNITVTETASIEQLNTVNKDVLYVGDKYIVIQSGSATSTELDGAGIQFGSGSLETPSDNLGSLAHVRYLDSEKKVELFPGAYVSGDAEISGNLNVSGSGVYKLNDTTIISYNTDDASYRFGHTDTARVQLQVDQSSIVGKNRLYLNTDDLTYGTTYLQINSADKLVINYETSSFYNYLKATNGFKVIGDQYNEGNAIFEGYVSASSFTGSFSGSFIGNFSQVTGLPTEFDKVIYVSEGANGADGTYNAPFGALDAALSYINNNYTNYEPVVIEIAPGSYTISSKITRVNTYFRATNSKLEGRAVKITGPVEVSGSGRDNQAYNDIVGFEGIFFSGHSSSPTFKISTNKYTTYAKDCYFTAGSSQNIILLDNNLVTGSNGAILSLKDSYILGNAGSDHLMVVNGGYCRLDSVQFQGPTSSIQQINVIKHSGNITNTAILADRILIDTGYTAHPISSSVGAVTAPGIYISNSSILSRGYNEVVNISNGHLFIVNTLIGCPSPSVTPIIKGTSASSYISYGSLTNFTPSAISFSNITQIKLNETFGDIRVSNLSASSGITGSFSGSSATITNITGTNIAANYLSASTISSSHVNVDFIDFHNTKYNISGNVTPGHQPGRIFFDSGSGDLVTALNFNNLYINNGQQLVQRVKNPTGEPLVKGKIVHISGSDVSTAEIPRVRIADWTNDEYSANTLGVVMANIGANSEGYIIIAGILDKLSNVESSKYNGGDILYLSSSGDFTNVKPKAPKHTVSIGQVIRTNNGSNGSIYVKIQNGYELEELHDVSSSNVTNGDLLVNNGSLWVNSKSLTGSYDINGSLTASTGFRTPENVTSYITASRSITSSYAISAEGVLGSENFARKDQPNTFAFANIFNAPITASSGVLFEKGFTVPYGYSGTFLGDIFVNGTASIAHLQTISQSSLNVGDKYIVILSASAEHTELDKGGLYWGSGNVGETTLDFLGAHAHINFDSLQNRLEVFPGLFVSGTLSGSNAILTSITSSNYSGSNALISVVTASQFTGSEAIINKITASSYTGSLANIGTITASYFTGSYGIINQVTASEYTGSRATITDVTASNYTGSLAIINTITASQYTGSTAVINTVTASYFTGSYAIINEITASSYTGSNALITIITASEISASRETVDILTASFISAGNISASNGITGSFSGSGALINNLTGSNWKNGVGGFYTDVASAFTGSGPITVKPLNDGTGRYEISSSGGTGGGGLGSVETEGSITGSGLGDNKVRLKENVTASYFTASVGISSSLYLGTTANFVFVTGSQYTASNGFTGSLSGNFGYISNVTASSGVSASFFYGNGTGITNVSASTSKLTEIVINAASINTDFNLSLLKTGSLMAISGTFLTTASCLDERKSNFIGVLTSKIGDSYTIATSGMVSGSNAGGTLFQGGQIVYVSSSGLCGTYDGIPANSYITQIGITSFDVQQSGTIILQPRIFGIKG